MSAAAVRQMPEPFTAAEVARYYKYRAPRLRRVGGELRGPCPIHQGKRDSFAVNPETGEWFCHSSCGRGGSLISFEVELSGKPFAEAAADVRSIVGRPEAPPRRHVVAEYDYLDENGRRLFQCLRYSPKDFNQRRPDGRGGWIYNLHGVRRVLFQLPSLVNASTVLVAEGEKDVLNLVNLGFVATCNPMGAKKWLPEYSDQLAGKDVVIFPDDDTPGREHVQQAGKSLVYKAKSMRVANVPAHDVSDWIEAGATADDIRAAIDSAAAFVPAGGDSEVAEVVDWRAGLLTNEKGFPKALLANAITALRDAPEWQGVLAFNEFSLVTVALKKLPWQSQEGAKEWTDQEDRLTANWLQHEGIMVSVEVAGQAVQAVARERAFHPVRDYLDGLAWDTTPRINTWLTEYLGVKATEYSAAVGAKWLISAVARIYQPGRKPIAASSWRASKAPGNRLRSR